MTDSTVTGEAKQSSDTSNAEISPGTDAQAPKRGRAAVLLNANAKRVTPKLMAKAAALVPEDELFCTHTFEEARQAAERIIAQGFSMVFTGGGDGTFMGTLHEMMKVIRERRQAGLPAELPRIGILKLGTGNALAALCGASGGSGVFQDIRRAGSGGCPLTRTIRLVETDDGILAPFVGVGLDAGILNFYVEKKKAAAEHFYGPLFEGAFGYFSAVVFKAVPKYLFRGHTTDIEVIARAPAWRCGPGDVLETEPAPAGTTLFRGPVLLASAGTTPFYGYKFKMFPLWNKAPGLMHLRIVALAPGTVVLNLPGVWKGTYRSPLVPEFLCTDVEIRSLNEKVPFQIGGDAGGYRESVRWKISDSTFDLVDFTPPDRQLPGV